MRGRRPKSDATRRRRNRSPSERTLPGVAASAGNVVPELPPREDGSPWHRRVVAWWAAVWTSPMAVEYLEADLKGGLSLLAELYQLAIQATSVKAVSTLAAEIRQQEARFGLSPFDRKRLSWTVEVDATGERSGSVKPARRGKDPRGVLSLV